MIIGLTGKMGSGKSAAVKLLEKNVEHTYIVKFAQPLYDIQEYIYKRVFGVAHNIVKDRKLLQWLGTEWGRSIDKDVWIKAWAKTAVSMHLNNVTVLNDDVRFDNEALKVKELGGTIIEIRSDKTSERIDVSLSGHASELGIDQKNVDYVVTNNGTLEEFETELLKVYNQILEKGRK